MREAFLTWFHDSLLPMGLPGVLPFVAMLGWWPRWRSVRIPAAAVFVSGIGLLVAGFWMKLHGQNPVLGWVLLVFGGPPGAWAVIAFLRQAWRGPASRRQRSAART